MKMVCISAKITGSDRYQTPGKIYEISKVSQYDEVTYSFIGDDGIEYLYFMGDPEFITIEEWREMMLKNILNEN